MKRGSKFLIGLAAAVLTYGSLMAFIGPRHFNCRGNYGHAGPWNHHGWQDSRHSPCPGHQDDKSESPSPTDKPTL